MSFPVRSKGRRGWPFAVIPRDAGVGFSPSFRRRPESRTGARGGERAFPANPCAGSWFRGDAGFMISQGRPPATARRQWRGWGGDIVGAVREPPVFLTAWADNPAIVRLVGAAGRSRTTPTGWLRIDGMKMRRRGNPRRRLDVAPCQIEGTPGLAFRRHSGEGRNPEPGRAAVNGCSPPIHARVHGFVGAVREPPVAIIDRRANSCPLRAAAILICVGDAYMRPARRFAGTRVL